MSDKSELLIVFHSLKLWLIALHCVQVLCCFTKQSVLLCFSLSSMRLMPRRTCSGVEFFGGFHIDRFILT
ncbi:hypothetical protein V2J09_012812 [Rumex salicifolius]